MSRQIRQKKRASAAARSNTEISVFPGYVLAKHEAGNLYPQSVFFSPNVCRCDAARDTQQIQASSAETGRDGGGGGVERRRYNVSADTI